MEAPQPARTLRESGENQYVWRASRMTSSRLAIPLLHRPALVHLRLEVRHLVLGDESRVVEEIRDRGAAEGVDDAIDHRGHRVAVGAPFLDSVVHLLFALLSDGDEVLVDQSIESRRDARVRDIAIFSNLVVDRPGRRRTEVADRPQYRQLKLAKLHMTTTSIVI